MKWLLTLMVVFSNIARGEASSQEHTPTPMEELDQFLGCPAFEDSFKLNDEVWIKSESCFGKSCSSFRTKQQVTAVSESDAEISSFDSAGKIFQQTLFSKEKWESLKCNWARIHIENMEGSGFKVELSQLTSSTHTSNLNGIATEFETRKVEIHGTNMLGMKIHHTLELCRDCGGLGQMTVREQESFTGGLDRYTVEDINRAGQ